MGINVGLGPLINSTPTKEPTLDSSIGRLFGFNLSLDLTLVKVLWNLLSMHGDNVQCQRLDGTELPLHLLLPRLVFKLVEINGGPLSCSWPHGGNDQMGEQRNRARRTMLTQYAIGKKRLTNSKAHCTHTPTP